MALLITETHMKIKVSIREREIQKHMSDVLASLLPVGAKSSNEFDYTSSLSQVQTTSLYVL